MRERVGSRRASFLDYTQTDHLSFMNSIITEDNMMSMHGDPQDSSAIDGNKKSIRSNIERSGTIDKLPESATSAQEATQPKHGLRRWVDAGGFRIYLFLFIFYPIAQGTRIVSDSFVRFWAEKTFFSSQQANLEVYSWLVGGYVDCSSQTHFYTCISTTALVVFTFSF
jgi:hypothetical protein